MDVKRLEEHRARRAELAEELAAVDEQIRRIESACAHEWGPDTGHAPNYELKGNAGLVTYGWWTRTCQKCGRVARTTSTRLSYVQVPVWD